MSMRRTKLFEVGGMQNLDHNSSTRSLPVDDMDVVAGGTESISVSKSAAIPLSYVESQQLSSKIFKTTYWFMQLNVSHIGGKVLKVACMVLDVHKDIIIH